MAIALVQTAALGAISNGSSQQTLAFGVNPTVGNYIVAWAWGWNSTTTSAAPAFSDTGSNAYTTPTNGFQFRANDLWLAVAYAKVVTSGATFKVTITKATAWATGNLMVVASEFSGIPATSPLDGTAAGTTGTTGVPAPGNLTLTSGSLVVAVFTSSQTTYNTFGYSTPAGFTRVGFQDDGTNFQVGEAVYAINPASPSNPSWKTGTVAWGAAQFALKAAGAAAFVAGPPIVVRQAVKRAAFY